MAFFIISIALAMLILILLTFTVYMYIKLVIAVSTYTEVPNWMYKIGQAFKSKININYEDFTEPAALWDTNFFILCFILANIFFYFVMYYQTQNSKKAFYICVGLQVVVVLIAMLLYFMVKLILFFVSHTLGKYRPLYSPTNAVMAGIFVTALVYTLWMLRVGFPEKPINIQIDNSTVVIGETKASSLLADGFEFYGKDADSEIVNKRNSQLHYGVLVELLRDGKSYGYMSITPTFKNSDKLENCTITYYEIPGDSEVLSQVKVSDTTLSELSIQDFQHKDMADIFSLKPYNYHQYKRSPLYTLQIQTAGYSLWKSYNIEADFFENGSVHHYGVRAQHTIWE